ncbi:MAG: YceI family protein [Pyrinomonadaceae bacterium MAG19_C2-C3]|nr:YceI family protein [Pyrinomonadaceae bacterium MAG19_C2-C3]
MRHLKLILAALLITANLTTAIYTSAAEAQNQTTAPPRDGNNTRATYAPITGGVYKIDPAHSSINFVVRHMMINNVRGRFTDFAGTINYDDRDLAKSSVEFTAKVASISTDVARRDEHLRSADFFDAAKYPELTFKSTRVVKQGDAYQVIGVLTMHGTSREVTIPFKLAGAIKNPRGSRIGIEGKTTINRQDYGITWGQTLDGGGLAVSNDVAVELLLEAIKSELAPETPATN